MGKQALAKLRGYDNTESVEAEVLEVVNSIDQSHGGSFATLLRDTKKELIVGVSMVIWQQITGQPSVLYYVSDMLEGDNDSAQDTAMKAVYVTSVKLVATLASVL